MWAIEGGDKFAIAKYTYKPRFWFFFTRSAVLVNALLAVFGSKIALNFPNVFTIISKNPDTLWLFILLGMFVLFLQYQFAMAIYVSFLPNREVTLSGKAISIPKSLLSPHQIEIQYRDIESFKLTGHFSELGIQIIHKNGKIKISNDGIGSRKIIKEIFFKINDHFFRTLRQSKQSLEEG